MPKHPKTVAFEGWSGINNVLRPDRTDPKYLKEALNVDFDKSGGIQKRLGYESISSGDYHSLWSDGVDCFAVKDDDLVRINPDLTETVLKSGINSTLSFDKIDGRVYYTGPGETGVILENLVSNWGIEEPNRAAPFSRHTGYSIHLPGHQIKTADRMIAGIDDPEIAPIIEGEALGVAETCRRNPIPIRAPRLPSLSGQRFHPV